MSDKRHFLDVNDLKSDQLQQILAEAGRRKTDRQTQFRGEADHDAPLQGKILAMIFEQPSMRTRVSFDVGMRQLGGETLLLAGQDLALGVRETVSDFTGVLSRYVDAIMIRSDAHAKLDEMVAVSSVPVINGLTDKSHPCQLMADVMTFEEHRGPIADKIITWSGDGNNMAASWIHGAARFGYELRLACPEELNPDAETVAQARAEGARIEVTTDPQAAADGADCLVADAWVSMHDDPASERHNLLRPYQVDDALMRRAADDAIFMHCMPAHREEEVTASVIDGPQSVIFDQAENRLHAQKAILTWCLGQADQDR